MVAWYYRAATVMPGKIETTEFAFYESRSLGDMEQDHDHSDPATGVVHPESIGQISNHPQDRPSGFFAVVETGENHTYYRYTMVPVKFFDAASLTRSKPCTDSDQSKEVVPANKMWLRSAGSGFLDVLPVDRKLRYGMVAAAAAPSAAACTASPRL